MHRGMRAVVSLVLVIALAGCNDDNGTVPVSDAAVTLQKQYIEVVKDVSPEVVQIQTPSGLGSGVVFDGQGDIVTNAHVVGTDQQFMVTLSDGQQHKASLVGSYPQGDIAVVRLADIKPRPA